MNEDITKLMVDDYNGEEYQLMDPHERFRDL